MRIAWAVITVYSSGIVIAIWFGRPVAGDNTVFGVAWSTVILGLAMVSSVAGTVISEAGLASSTQLHRVLICALWVLAVTAEILAFGHFAKADGPLEVMLGIFLSAVAVALIGTSLGLLHARVS